MRHTRAKLRPCGTPTNRPTTTATRVALLAGRRRNWTNAAHAGPEGRKCPQRARLELHSLQARARKGEQARNERDSSCTRCRLPANPAYTGLEGRTGPPANPAYTGLE